MFCGKCGAEYEEGALFCPKCGNNLQRNVNIPVQDMESRPVNQKKGNKKWLIVVLVIFLVLGGAGVTFWQTGMLLGENDDITRGYKASTTATEILEREEKRKDIKSFMGAYAYTQTSEWNEAKGIFEYTSTEVETDNPEEIRYIAYEGGKLFGVEAESIVYDFLDKKLLYEIKYVFSSNDYDKVEHKISKEFEDYSIVNDYGTYWSMEDYTIRMEKGTEGEAIVTVKFNETVSGTNDKDNASSDVDYSYVDIVFNNMDVWNEYEGQNPFCIEFLTYRSTGDVGVVFTYTVERMAVQRNYVFLNDTIVLDEDVSVLRGGIQHENYEVWNGTATDEEKYEQLKSIYDGYLAKKNDL